MTLSGLALLVAMVSSAAPVVAAFLRHRTGGGWLLSLLGSAVTTTFLVLVTRLVVADPARSLEPGLFALIAWGVPMVLVGHLLTAALGRESVRAAFVSVRRSFFLLAGAGALFLLFMRHPAVLLGYRWREGEGDVLFGYLGKAYLSYLLVGVVFIGHNLESTFRLAPGETRDRLRVPILGLFGVLGFFTYVLTSGLLYSSLSLLPLVAAAIPVTLANLFVAYGFLRGALEDRQVPVSRNVVYTSFTAFIAGIYVLAVGVIAQLAAYTRWSPGEAVTFAFVFLVAVTTLVLVFSPRLQRRVRRFIDRNFYVNRHDYRAQWFRVTRSLDPAHGVDGVVRGAAGLLHDVLRADEVTVALRDPATDVLAPRLGKGTGNAAARLADGAPLYRKLVRDRRALLLNRNPEDFEYIGIYVEDREFLDATASQVVAPLLAGQHFLGLIGLERRHPGDRFSFEDLDLLDNLAGHVAAVLRSVELAEALAAAREVELLSQWSSMLLHDLKNHLSPLRMIAQNMRHHADNPEFQREAAGDLARVADNLEVLVHRLSELRTDTRLAEEDVDLNRLLRRAAARLQLDRRPGLRIVEELRAEGGVKGDAKLLGRVIENLVVNAVEAMGDRGTLTFRTWSEPAGDGGGATVVLSVEDTGPGMPEDFVRNRLFKPFATTKPRGLGLGLYQSRSIVHAHGGELRVTTRPGAGTRFDVRLHPAGVPAGVAEPFRAASGGTRMPA